MQPTFSEIKRAARGALKHRWPEAITVSVVFIATLFLMIYMQVLLMSLFKIEETWQPFGQTELSIYVQLASIFITLFAAVFSLLILAPLGFGVMRWFWNVTGGGQGRVGEIFYYFSSGKIYFKAFILSLRLLLRLAVGAVICFLPYNILGILTTPNLYYNLGIPMPMVMDSLSPLVGFFYLCGIMAFLLWTGIYFLCYTVIFSEGGLTVTQIIRRTVKVSRGFRFNSVGFILSFFGWLLLSLLAVPVIFTLPYLLASLAVYGREVYRASKHSEQLS